MLWFLCGLLLPAGFFLGLQVVVQTSESVHVESILHTLVIAVTVLLQVVKQVSMTTVLENQVYGSYKAILWLVQLYDIVSELTLFILQL